FDLGSTLTAFSINAGLNIGVNYAFGERNVGKLLINGTLAGLAGAAAGPLVAYADSLAEGTVQAAAYKAVANGTVALIFNELQQGVDYRLYGDVSDQRKAAVAFGLASAPTFVLDLAIQSSTSSGLADDPATKVLIDIKLGAIGEIFGSSADAVFKAWDKVKKAMQDNNLPVPPGS
ncbi:MAG: hypothetical protein ABSA33_06705, partial [Candidatus Micrarchaeaceae archaeon]